MRRGAKPGSCCIQHFEGGTCDGADVYARAADPMDQAGHIVQPARALLRAVPNALQRAIAQTGGVSLAAPVRSGFRAGGFFL